jgi:hypothetical protein
MKASFLPLAVLALSGIGVAHAQDTSGCPAHSAAYKIEDTSTATIVHCHCATGYHATNGECVPPPPPPSTPRLSCAVAEERVRADLEQIQRQRELAVENQAQFAEWNKIGNDGKQDLLKATLELTAGTYASNLEHVSAEMKALQTQEAALSASVKAANTSARAADLAKLKQLTSELLSQKISFGLQTTAKTGLDAAESWELAQGTMHDGFSAAASTDAQLAAEMENPSVREDLLGPKDENPLYEHTASVVKAALGELVDSGKLLEHYKAVTGPTVRVASFVIDGAYADLEIWFAANGADQADQTAGQLARAAGVMQAKFRQDMQAKQTCTP